MTGAPPRPRSIDLGMYSRRQGAEACEWTSVIYAITLLRIPEEVHRHGTFTTFASGGNAVGHLDSACHRFPVDLARKRGGASAGGQGSSSPGTYPSGSCCCFGALV